MSSIVETYHQLHPRSAQLHQEAQGLFPDGVTHDNRRFWPFPMYVERAEGARKWDVDGNEIIDYVVGHGALLLGHSHPAVAAAVQQQAARGTHYGASHELEVKWGAWVKRLVPSAEMVRFTSSGTEATLMAIRLARAFTGRDKIVRFEQHFHGWHDNVVGVLDGETPVARWPGVPEATLSNVIVIPANDIDLVEETLRQNPDVAAVIMEPTGASWGTFPLVAGFLEQVREATHRHNVLLIMDEVITGFRVAPGGAQGRFGVRPDLTTMAKILAGGLPGGAVAGRRDLLSLIETGDEQWNARRRIAHPGTFNANPLSAAAGAIALSLVADGQLQRQADDLTRRLGQGMNQAIKRRGVAGCVYGFSSMFHILLGRQCPEPVDGLEWPLGQGPTAVPERMRPELALALKQGMLNMGVDLMGAGGMLSAAHGEREVEATVEAFEASVSQMQREGLL
ncbi:MAG: aspartate aminotransferase family protein [Dehalococcoidia bacterium]